MSSKTVSVDPFQLIYLQLQQPTLLPLPPLNGSKNVQHFDQFLTDSTP